MEKQKTPIYLLKKRLMKIFSNVKIMKKIFTLIYLMIAFGVFPIGAAAQKKMSVNDYFLAIPQEYLKIDSAQRTKIIDESDAQNGYLKFNVPLSKDEDWGGAEVWGEVQIFSGKAGKTLVAMAVNRCLEAVCMGQLLMLDYAGGEFTNVSETFAPEIDNDEIVGILKESPAYERPIIKDEEIPLAIGFARQDKLISYLAACTSPGCDGAVVAKNFKWNGAKFQPFEYEVSP